MRPIILSLFTGPAKGFVLSLTVVALFLGLACDSSLESPRGNNLADAGYVGSARCRDCHERFYELWEPSHHGKAIQPYNKTLAQAIMPHTTPLKIEGNTYQAHLMDERGWVIETTEDGITTLPIHHAMGGKNVYFFLTPMERGRLQVLPLAYHVGANTWYSATDSMIRHFDDIEDEAIDWRDPLLTFNTSCFDCHVSQLTNDYDAETDSYTTTWREPGVNCEACHGPGGEHVRVCLEAGDGAPPEDVRILKWGDMTPDQRDDTCSACHAKRTHIAPDFHPGARFFDHYDLVCLEDSDFYPDGRDLGENYTYTGWLMNPCVLKGELECIHCHTSSGRYRFADPERANDACRPCHNARVDNALAHTRHPVGSPGGRCVNCHAPTTAFAQMRRSDHSLRPPMPALSKRVQSPNACVLCHQDKDNDWALDHVMEWFGETDRVKREMERATLIEAARTNDRSRLSDILSYIGQPDSNAVFVTSLIRLLPEPLTDKQESLLREQAISAPSPMTRAAALARINPMHSPENLIVALEAIDDASRIVRIQAGQSLAPIPLDSFPTAQRERVQKSVHASWDTLTRRLDHWTAHYNLGNRRMSEQNPRAAAPSFDQAASMRPDILPPLLNASMAYAQSGDLKTAEERLKKALKIARDAERGAVHFNLGLLLAETDRPAQAITQLEAALAADPHLAQAAYNLAMLVIDDDPEKALALLKHASAEVPTERRYRYALAFYQRQQGKENEAEQTLRQAIRDNAATDDAVRLLITMLQEQGRADEAQALLEQIRRP